MNTGVLKYTMKLLFQEICSSQLSLSLKTITQHSQDCAIHDFVPFAKQVEALRGLLTDILNAKPSSPKKTELKKRAPTPETSLA